MQVFYSDKHYQQTALQTAMKRISEFGVEMLVVSVLQGFEGQS